VQHNSAEMRTVRLMGGGSGGHTDEEFPLALIAPIA
jgi:hypothetical protein